MSAGKGDVTGEARSAEPVQDDARARERNWRQLIFRARALSPMGFFVCAAVLSLFFGVAHLLGLRMYTSILCGTLPPGALAGRGAVSLGMVYVILYMALVIVVPVLVLGGLLFLVACFRAERRAGRVRDLRL